MSLPPPVSIDLAAVINAQIWELLWRSSGPDNRLTMNICDAVLFRNSLPYRWYFTSQSGEVKRKNKLNCTASLIEAAFSPLLLSTDDDPASSTAMIPDESRICATWFGNIPVEDVFTSGIAAKVAAGTKSASTDGPPPPLVRIDAVVPEQDEPTESGRFICGKTGLRTFLLDNTKARSGILLKFVEPKDNHNEVIRCTWSANVVFINKRICKANITLWKSAPPSARALTYESGGAERSAPETSVLSHYLTVEMSRLSEMIVQHCAHVSSGTVLISTLTTHWKIDKSDRLIFLWASGVTLRGGSGPYVPRGVSSNAGTIVHNHQRKFNSATPRRKDGGTSDGISASTITAKLLMAPSSPIRPGQEFEKVPNRYTLGYESFAQEKKDNERDSIHIVRHDDAISDTSKSALAQRSKNRPKRAAQSAPGGRTGAVTSLNVGEESTEDAFNIDDDLDKLIDKDDEDEDNDDEDDDEIRLETTVNKKISRRWINKSGFERGSSAPLARSDHIAATLAATPQTISETVKDVIKRAQSANVAVRPLSSPTSRHSSSSIITSRSAESSNQLIVSPRKNSAISRPINAVNDILEGKDERDNDRDISASATAEPDVNSWRPLPSNMKTPAFSRILPLVGPKAHAQALAQGEIERSAISVGRSVAHDPLWECPSCGTASTASELACVSTLDVMRHYSTLLNSLHLQPRESQKLPNGARRRSDALDDCCYWPIDAAHVAALAGGVGVYFAYVMPEGATRVIANEPYSTPYYIDKWLFQREERIHPSLPTARLQTEDEEAPKNVLTLSLAAQERSLETEKLLDPVSLKQARRKRIDIQMMLAEEEEQRAKSYTPVFSGATPFTSSPQQVKQAFPLGLAANKGLKHDEPEKITIEATRIKGGSEEKEGVEEFNSVLLGLSPTGRAIVRALSPTLARCFPSLSPSQIQLMQHGKPVEVLFGPIGVGNSAHVSSVPVCSDCYCAYRAFADTLLSGQQPQQALEITSARFMRINGKVALRTEVLAESAGTLSQLPDVRRVPPTRTVMSAAQERQVQRKLEKESWQKPNRGSSTGSASARTSRSTSRSAKSRREESRVVQDSPVDNMVADKETAAGDDEIEREERKLRLAKSALQEAQQMVAKIQADKEASRLNQRELMLKAEAFVKRQETQKEMFIAADEIRKRTAALESGGRGGNVRSRPTSAKPEITSTSRPNSGKNKPGSKAPSRSNSAKERQQQQQLKQEHRDQKQTPINEGTFGPDGDDIFSSSADVQSSSANSEDISLAVNPNHTAKPPRPSSAFASMPTTVMSASAISSSRHGSRPSSAQSTERTVTADKSADNIAVYEFMSGEASSSQLQLMQPSISSIASNDSNESFSTPFAPMIQNSQTFSISSVVSSTPSAYAGVPPTTLRPSSASLLTSSVSARSGAMLAGSDWMDFYRKELNNRLGHLAPKTQSVDLDVTSSTLSLGTSHSKSSLDLLLSAQQPPPPVPSLAPSPYTLQEPSQSQQQLQQMPHVFENAVKSFRESLKIIGASSFPPPYTPLSSTLGMLSSSSIVSTPESEPQPQPQSTSTASSSNSNTSGDIVKSKTSKSINSRPYSGSSFTEREPFSVLTGPASLMALRKELTATSTTEDNRRSVLKINSDVENAKPSSVSRGF